MPYKYSIKSWHEAVTIEDIPRHAHDIIQEGGEYSWGRCESCGQPLFDADCAGVASYLDGVYECASCVAKESNA